MSNLLTGPKIQTLASAVGGLTFPEHPHFPQLRVASEPGAMLELFREHLRPASKSGAVISDCIPVRFRWRGDGSRCVLQYALKLGADGSQPLASLWVTVVLFANASQAETAWTKQTAEFERRLIPTAYFPFEPLTLIPEFSMLVYVFPYDRLLPTLPEYMRGPWAELEQQLIACFGPGRWQIEQKCVEALRYRVEDSAVLRYTLHARDRATSKAERRRFYAKVYRSAYGEQIAQILRQLHQRTRATEQGFAVAEPVFYCPQRLCLVLAEAPGHTLQEALMRGSEEPAHASVRCVARALAAFNKHEIATSVKHSAGQQLEFLERAAVLLRWAFPDSSPAIDQIVRTVREGLQDVAPVPIHWDLKTDHIFLEDGRVTFVDLDTVSWGDPARDPAHLAAHVACRLDEPGMTARVARSAAEAFVKEYFSQVPASWRRQFGLQFPIAVLEGACGLFKRQEPGWRARAMAALEEADSFLRRGSL